MPPIARRLMSALVFRLGVWVPCLALAAAGVAGCGVIPRWGYDNDPASPPPGERKIGQYSVEEVRSGSDLASLGVNWDVDWKCRNSYPIAVGAVRDYPFKDCPRSDDRFVGIAMSGGGSRAAVFSAAVLFELKKYGILQQVDVLSSVSGGSYTAALYALSCDDPKNCPPTVEGPARTIWDEGAVFEKLQKDFIGRWIGNWFWPNNIFMYWLTDYNRSQIMAKTLDASLFDNSNLGSEGYRFQDLNPQRPHLIINATDFSDHGPSKDGLSPYLKSFPDSCRGARFFTFTQDIFSELNANLDQYRIADAVVASSAFPGVFNDITLKDFKQNKYVHLFDAGPFDNLGLTSLMCALDEADTVKKPKRKAVLLIDASASPQGQSMNKASTRQFVDFFVDTNLLDSVDILFERQRRDKIEEMQDLASLVVISFQGLGEQDGNKDLYDAVNGIPTDLSIEDWQAKCLRRAAAVVVGQVAEQILERGKTDANLRGLVTETGVTPDLSKAPECVKPPPKEAAVQQ